ncbi:MAG TPA: sodium:solute symporter family protein [archaeon]|nr:sodium:solute symporter family protein [archaeon]
MLLMLGIGFVASRRQTLEGYFVNDRKTKMLMILSSTVSTQVGAAVVIGTVGVTYQYGIGFGIAASIAVILGWIIVALVAGKIKAFGDRSGAFTIGDFYEHRYSKRTKYAASAVLAIAIFFWMAVGFVALGGMFSVLTGWDMALMMPLAAGVTIVYSATGGIKADIYSDFIQFWMMLLLFIMLIPLGLSRIGGLEAFRSLASSHFYLFTYGGPGLFFGVIFLAIPFSLVSMDVWQRIYASESGETAKKAFTLAAIINPMFYIGATVIGLIAAIAFPRIAQDTALFTLMQAVLPPGLLGIGMASLIAVVMSSLDSTIVMLSTIATKDFYKSLINRSATQQQMLRTGKAAALISSVTALGIAYAMPSIITLTIYGTSLILVFAPVIIGGLLWERATEKAAILSIITGLGATFIFIPTVGEAGVLLAMISSTIAFMLASFFAGKPEGEHFHPAHQEPF